MHVPLKTVNNLTRAMHSLAILSFYILHSVKDLFLGQPYINIYINN
jgi:hypothetical protein